MSLEIAYAAMGGDLETVRGRLLTDERIEKFAKIFLQDTSMQTLESALEAGDLSEAYRGAHTLKGVAQNLDFGDLGRSGFDPGGGVLRVHDHIVQSGITQALHRQGAADGGEGSQALAALVKFF